MMWLQVIIATGVGFACGFWLAMEVGRIIYNHKMDELRQHAQRFTERGVECRKAHVSGYTGPICSCGPTECKAAKGESETKRFNRDLSAVWVCRCGSRNGTWPWWGRCSWFRWNRAV